MDMISLTAVELGKKIQAKEISAREAAEAAFAQIDRVEADVHSYVTIDREGALKRAGRHPPGRQRAARHRGHRPHPVGHPWRAQ